MSEPWPFDPPQAKVEPELCERCPIRSPKRWGIETLCAECPRASKGMSAVEVVVVFLILAVLTLMLLPVFLMALDP